MTQRTAFVGDAHLGSTVGVRHRQLVGFLEQLEVDHLFAMGDLFEFLYGHPQLRDGAAPVLDALDTLAAGGTSVTYLEGNHDFNMAPLLSPAVDVWKGPGEVQLGPLRVHLAHGDQVHPWDPGYAVLRRAVRTRAFGRLAERVGPRRLKRWGERSADASRELEMGRSRDWRPHKKRYVRRLTLGGVDVVVLGHSHKLIAERIGDGWVVQCGAFDERRQHALLVDRKLRLISEEKIVWEGEVG